MKSRHNRIIRLMPYMDKTTSISWILIALRTAPKREQARIPYVLLARDKRE